MAAASARTTGATTRTGPGRRRRTSATATSPGLARSATTTTKMMMMKKKKNGRTTASASKRPTIETRLVHLAGKLEDPFDSVAPPLYQTATFNQPGATDFGAYDYSRSGNPTRTLLENQMADIENADGAFAFASGMAAIATVMRLVKPGECVLAGNDIYGGTQRFLGKIAPAKQGLTVKHVDMTQVEEVKAALEEGTKVRRMP